MDLIPLRMIKAFGGCNPGEVAGFLPHVAEQLIKQGAAEHAPKPVAQADDTEEQAEPAAATKTSTKKS